MFSSSDEMIFRFDLLLAGKLFFFLEPDERDFVRNAAFRRPIGSSESAMLDILRGGGEIRGESRHTQCNINEETLDVRESVSEIHNQGHVPQSNFSGEGRTCSTALDFLSADNVY